MTKHETFEDRLLGNLLDEWSPAGPGKATHRGRTAAAVGGPLLAAGVVGALLLPSAHSDGRGVATTAAPAANGSTGTVDVRPITDRVNDAMAKAHDVIIHADQTTWAHEDRSDRGTRSEMWSDAAGFGFRDIEYGADGHKVVDAGSMAGTEGTTQHRSVDIGSRTVTEWSTPTPPNRGGETLIGDLRDARPVGTETIDGVTTTHLLDGEPGMNREIWVDASSLLPVRMTAHGTWGAYRIDYDWLARTDANRAQLLPVAPDGYRVVQRTSVPDARGLAEQQDPGTK